MKILKSEKAASKLLLHPQRTLEPQYQSGGNVQNLMAVWITTITHVSFRFLRTRYAGIFLLTRQYLWSQPE